MVGKRALFFSARSNDFMFPHDMVKVEDAIYLKHKGGKNLRYMQDNSPCRESESPCAIKSMVTISLVKLIGRVDPACSLQTSPYNCLEFSLSMRYAKWSKGSATCGRSWSEITPYIYTFHIHSIRNLPITFNMTSSVTANCIQGRSQGGSRGSRGSPPFVNREV